jgi:hypothetical protein
MTPRANGARSAAVGSFEEWKQAFARVHQLLAEEVARLSRRRS